MNKKFQKRVEDFVCEKCGHAVAGSGYTNHCSKCLWSKHVDMHPGDRAAGCGGLMEPIALEGSSPNYRIVHRCTMCKAEKIVDAAGNDSPKALLKLAQHS